MATVGSATSQTTPGVTAPASGGIAGALSGNQQMGQNDFLKLLVTQLKNQDPLKPMDNTAFVAELAQFSQLDQSTKQVQLLEKSIAQQADSMQYTLLPMIGRNVQVEGSLIDLNNGPAKLTYALEREASTVRVTIQDKQGKALRILDLGTQSAGKQEVQWDGRNQNGQLMPNGTYQYQVLAKDSKGGAVVAAPSSVLKISGVRMVNGSPQLAAGDYVIDRNDIVELR
ncbi:flagellar hook assembly protein FlgD [Nitrospira lenta]|uniref:Basal-body rod modification protein FlgD n=1 Tax=Nitrospira lenta TaxID=1436998 RepID=A0A330L5U9_9BACT|nr:flagellar hook assembly protein FlgD [Nitrospira lenta]SPP65205.1 putative Basal-body rod modification protein FlgD [Nitrospira lenta]